MRLELGKPVRTKDDVVVGELADVVIDPVEKRVTHLVVKPHHGPGASHLVEIELAVSEGDAGEISLRCDAEEVRKMPNVEDFAYVRLGAAPVSDPDWDVGVADVLAMPYYDDGLGGYGGPYDSEVGMVYDRVPKGEVEIRRSSNVVTADGEYVGDVDGFVIEGGRITHVVIERGRFWSRREVTVPIGSVARVESDSVTLDLSKDALGALPQRRLRRWFGGRKTP